MWDVEACSGKSLELEKKFLELLSSSLFALVDFHGQSTYGFSCFLVACGVV